MTGIRSPSSVEPGYKDITTWNQRFGHSDSPNPDKFEQGQQVPPGRYTINMGINTPGYSPLNVEFILKHVFYIEK